MTEINASGGIFAQKPDTASNALSTLMALFAGGADGFANEIGELQGVQSFSDLVNGFASGDLTEGEAQDGLEAWSALFSGTETLINPEGRSAFLEAFQNSLSTAAAQASLASPEQLADPETFAQQSFAPLFALTSNARAALGTDAVQPALQTVSVNDKIIAEAFPELANLIGVKPEGFPLADTGFEPAYDLAKHPQAERIAAIMGSLEARAAEASLTAGAATGLDAGVASGEAQQSAATLPSAAATPASPTSQAAATDQATEAAVQETAQAQVPAEAEISGLTATAAQAVQPGKAEIAATAATIKDGHVDADKADDKANAQPANTAQNTTNSNGSASGSGNSGSGQSNQQSQGGQGQQHSDPQNDQKPERGQTPAAQTAAPPKPEFALNGRSGDAHPMTPERLAGWSDIRPFEAIAGGLSSLRSETSLNEPSILVNRANPNVAQDAMRQMSVAVARAVEDGDTNFTVRLNPAELGRVTVKLSFTENGGLKAAVMAQSPETLDMLQRDMRGLERAMEAGGHKIEAGGLQLSLDKGDEESAGKQMAEALLEERMKDNLAANSGQHSAGGEHGSEDSDHAATMAGGEMTDDALLEQIISHVSPETGLDIRI